MSPGVDLEIGKQSRNGYLGGRAGKKMEIGYLNTGTRYTVPSAGGSIPPENLLGSVAAPDRIINACSSPDRGPGEFCPGVVVVVPLVDRLA